MTARIIEHLQGTPGWHQHRATHFNASDAPAMLGLSSYKSRGELLREKHTGITPDVDGATQKRFDKGHAYEAMARPWAEEIIGEELYPVVLADELHGLALSASLDGLTMDDSTAFEHKTLNDKLRSIIDAGDTLPEEYRVQMEQQMLISGATHCLFMASSGGRDDMRHRWYERSEDLAARVIRGWIQFDKDLDAYEPPAVEKPVTGSAPSALPALRIEVSGAVTDSNLDAFRDHAIAVFEGIRTDLQTDQDFADAEQAVKYCKAAEKELYEAKGRALRQTQDIAALFATIDEISDEARQKRLELDKLVKSMKEQRKQEILRDAERDYDAHLGEIEKDLEGGCDWPIRFPSPRPEIDQAMKGKRTLATLRDAADSAVANAKIEADRIARGIRANLDVLKTEADGFATLFPDGGQLATNKTTDDLRNTIKARIAAHQAQERQRVERQANEAKAQNEPSPEQSAPRAEQSAPRAEQSAPKPQQAVPKRVAEKAVHEVMPPAPVEPPSDEQIIGCVADAFDVDDATARDWIAGMDMIGAEA